MKCALCGNAELVVFHKGLRDRKDIDMLKCTHCELLQISKKGNFDDASYEKGGMHNDAYDAEKNEFVHHKWEEWVEQSRDDDIRRVMRVLKICKHKKLLDFGCGAGGFLKGIKTYSPSTKVCGVELENFAREKLKEDNIQVFKTLEETDDQFDIITMFHVIEHLNHPEKIIKLIESRLTKNGILIIETPNSNDALMSIYNNKYFTEFTLWSAHVRLYNSKNLNLLLEKCGFYAHSSEQVQRYTLANHLYWLTNNKPGGHKNWAAFNDDIINKRYFELLALQDSCDTLFSVYYKQL